MLELSGERSSLKPTYKKDSNKQHDENTLQFTAWLGMAVLRIELIS